MPEIIKISHGLTIGDLKYGNARPGVVEATLKPGETMEQALDELDERLNAWHRKRYPHLYQEPVSIVSQWQHQESNPSTTTTYSGGQPTIIDLSVERLEIAIDNCQSIEELDQLKQDNPLFPARLLESFNKKRKELTV